MHISQLGIWPDCFLEEDALLVLEKKKKALR